MICATCGGRVEWRGPFSNLTHTECTSCGRINNQEPEPVDDDEEEDEAMDKQEGGEGA